MPIINQICCKVALTVRPALLRLESLLLNYHEYLFSGKCPLPPPDHCHHNHNDHHDHTHYPADIILVMIWYPKMAMSSSRSTKTLKRFSGSQERTNTIITDNHYCHDFRIIIILDNDFDDDDDENLHRKPAGRPFSSLAESLAALAGSLIAFAKTFSLLLPLAGYS